VAREPSLPESYNFFDQAVKMAFNMAMPWKAMSLGSGLAAYLVTSRQEEPNKVLFITLFTGAWTAMAFIWVIYASFLWPFLLSPLRHVPEPKGNHWLHGQWERIKKDPTGVPQADCTNAHLSEVVS
jgi:hypothetical protein